jgi:8-amino-7-oxononanoate synthase
MVRRATAAILDRWRPRRYTAAVTLRWIDEALATLSRAGLLREPSPPIVAAGPYVERGGRRYLNLCSNDYLSLARRDARGPAGAGASRLIVGDTVEHRTLEGALAEWLGVESVLLFSSGYAANVGAISALVGPEDLVVSDALNHASIIDGCRLSRARVEVVGHRDVAAFDAALARPARRKLVVTDGYFSMDGTRAPVGALAEVCRRHEAMFHVDEAHGFGVWGPHGRGVCAEANVVPDIWMGTLGKAFGASGAFIAGRRSLTTWLWNRARSFVFSTGLAPASATAALAALPVIREGAQTAALHANVRVLRDALGSRADGEGPIVPIVIGDPARTVAISRELFERGLFAQAIRPPTVPAGTSRLRITVQAGHEPVDLARAGALIKEAVG